MKIDGRRVLVDVERARTVKGWLPRRLGKDSNLSYLIFYSNLFRFKVAASEGPAEEALM